MEYFGAWEKSMSDNARTRLIFKLVQLDSKMFNTIQSLGGDVSKVFPKSEKTYYDMSDKELAEIYVEYYGTEEDHESFEDFYFFHEEWKVIYSKTII